MFSAPISKSVVRNCLLLTLWGGVLTGTLSIANWPGDWGHSVCGAWGCGPPLQALVACHLSWLVVLAPLALLFAVWASPRVAVRGAAAGLALGLSAIGAVAIDEYLNWLLQASAWQQPYYWHRVGFVLLTRVEIPILEVTGLSTLVLLRGMSPIFSDYRGEIAGDETASSNGSSASGRE